MKSMDLFKAFTYVILTALTVLRSTPILSATELPQGRYVGYFTLDDGSGKIAVLADLYVESPDDLRQFPKLNALFRYSFGGYSSGEYFTETFEDLRYDFDDGNLTFDEAANDFLMTTLVSKVGSDTIISGQGFIRSSAVSGSLYLKYLTDEPGGDDSGGDEPGSDSVPFMPTLDGDYEGVCDGEHALFQIQTHRGLSGDDSATGLNRHYGITGRLAFDDARMCGDSGMPRNWCSWARFSSGAWNPYLGKLTLHGARSSQGCDLKKGVLTCSIRRQNRSAECSFQKKDLATSPAVFSSRRHYVRTTPDQRQELPAANPPRNQELSNALRGNFNGYVHNEMNDTYQRVSLNVMPYSSTNNPHNPNQMMITTTLVTYFDGPDRAANSDFTTQRFEPRSFYLRPGFTLNGPEADAYINIAEWKSGYIRGDFFSHGFGRVGTVQLVKGEASPFPAGAKTIRSFAGTYEGPVAPDGTLTRIRWFNLLFPTQPNEVIGHVLKFRGTYQAVSGLTAIVDINAGTFDPYTGRFGWTLTKGGETTFTSGSVRADADVDLFWPPAPDVFGTRVQEYKYNIYRNMR